MEVCTTTGTISNIPHRGIFTSNQTLLPWKTSLRLKSIHRTNLGLQYYTNSSLKSSTSEETSSGASLYSNEETDGVITVEDVQKNESDVQNFEKNESDGTGGTKEESSVDDQIQPFEFLDKLNIELDSESPFPVLLFGGGSLVALWLTTAVVGAIDSIPVFPKLMEVVGLAYSLWFSTRYLLFKENRDELTAKIEEIKQQVLGSNDD